MRLFIFFLPIIAIMVLPTWVLWKSGEFLSNDVMVDRQITDPGVRIGLAYSNPIYYLSLKSVLVRRPAVLVLGSSRVGQIHSDFFAVSSSVYVAGGPIQTMNQFRYFLDKLSEKATPQLLLAGLDQKFFDPAYNFFMPGSYDSALTQPITVSDVFANWPSVYRDYWLDKFSLEKISRSSSFIGMQAIMFGSGYRNDGSYDPGYNYHAETSLPEDRFKSTLLRIENGTDDFAYSKIISNQALQELEAFLQECSVRHIKVIGFAPPLAPTVYNRMISLPDKYRYLSGLPSSVSAIFAKYNFGFYDFTNPRSVGITDKEMQDGIHTTDRGSLMFFTQMAATDPILKQYTDAGFLKQRLRSSAKEYDLVP